MIQPPSSNPSSRRPVVPEPLPVSILLVEDNDANLRVTELLLQRLGYKADIARNGVQAVDASRSKHYDLILMDLHLPILGGLEAAQQIVSELAEGKKRPLILALTSTSSSEHRDEWLAAGMDGFLSKPFKPSDFNEWVDRHFRT
jgi:CheY-like chemotaxis protein